MFHLRQISSLQKKSEQTIAMKMVTVSEIFLPYTRTLHKLRQMKMATASEIFHEQQQCTNYNNRDGHDPLHMLQRKKERNKHKKNKGTNTA